MTQTYNRNDGFKFRLAERGRETKKERRKERERERERALTLLMCVMMDSNSSTDQT